MAVTLLIPSLGNKFQDYRDDILGDSYGWGPPVQADKVRYLAFHHSVTPQTAKDDGDWKKECDYIAKIHVQNNGWAGVGYRFIICSDGTVAYVGDLSHGGSAVTGNNDIIFSACFVGDFTKVLPTAAQVHSAYILAKFFIESLPQYPLLDSWEDIIGHRDAAELLHLLGATATTCPSPVWRTGADTLRDRIVQDRFSGYPNPQPTWALPAPVPPSIPPPVPQPPTVITEPSARILVNGREMELRQVEALITDLSNQIKSLTFTVEADNLIIIRDAKARELAITLRALYEA